MNHKKPLILLATVAVILTALTIGHRKLAPVTSQAGIIVQSENLKKDTAKAIVAGCFARAMQDERFGTAPPQARINACQYMIGDLVGEAISGHSECHKTDLKCMYALGYVRTALALGSNPKTPEEISALQSEIDSTFEKLQ